MADALEHKRKSLVAWLGEAELEGVGKILEVGCGRGYLSKMLRELYPHAEVFGLDNDVESLAYALRSGYIKKGHAIHGNALNLADPESPVARPVAFYSIGIEKLLSREKDGGAFWDGSVETFGSIDRVEVACPEGFDLAVSHDLLPEKRFDDMLEAHKGSNVPIDTFNRAVKRGGYLLYSVPVFVCNEPFDEGKAHTELLFMGREAHNCGFEGMGGRVVGDLDEYKKWGFYGELNVGILCRRKRNFRKL